MWRANWHLHVLNNMYKSVYRSVRKRRRCDLMDDDDLADDDKSIVWMRGLKVSRKTMQKYYIS